MRCIRCGKFVDDAVAFCPHCGYEQKKKSDRGVDVLLRRDSETKLPKFKLPGKRGLAAVIAAIVLLILFGGNSDSGERSASHNAGGSGSSTSGTKSGTTSGSSGKKTNTPSKNEELCVTCDGDKDCIACDGKGYCGFCEGTGKSVCTICWGADYCQNCGGDGIRSFSQVRNGSTGEKCGVCNGKGKCTVDSCDGGYQECVFCKDGRKPCHICDGEKTCVTCQGEGGYDTAGKLRLLTGYKTEEHECYYGEVLCDHCDGGECTFCDGSGKKKCNSCNGSGCKYCVGGYNTCTYCEGTRNCMYCYGKHTRKCPYCVDGYTFNDYQFYIGKESSDTPSNNGGGSDKFDITDYFQDECNTCFGRKEIDCWCNGGECTECSGDGYVPVYNPSDTGVKKKKCSECSNGLHRVCGGDGIADCPDC